MNGRLPTQTRATSRSEAPGFARISRHQTLLFLTLIFLVASAFRFIGLDSYPTPRGASPPGLEHDEVAHWLINQDILAGHHAIYFTEAYGHEALYHYLQAGFGALVGDHALALRLPSAYFGLLVVAVGYALGRRLFDVRVGLWAAVFLAVLFWPVFYSRLALRAISLPVFSGLAAWWWWRGWGAGGNEHARPMGFQRYRSLLPFILAGLFAGLSLHTYMAARAVPIFFLFYTIYLLLVHRAEFRGRLGGIVLFWVVLVLVTAPLVVFLATNPGAESRISEVDAPLRALLEGDLRPVIENAVRIAATFGLSGDPLWRQNVAGRPVFDPIMAVLFYGGVVYSLWRWRDPRHTFLSLWLVTSTIPSLVTIDAPSSIRIINLLPVLMLFPLVFIHKALQLSTLRDKLSTELVTRVITLSLATMAVYTAWSTVNDLWRVWPRNEEVRFVWQAALTEAAAHLDQSPESGPVAIGGWTPDTMDPPTMELTLHRDDLALRYFDPTQSLVLPKGTGAESIRIVTPSALPLAPYLRQLVAGGEQPMGEFVVFELAGTPAIQPETALARAFGGEVQLLGYDTISGCEMGESCALATYWQVLSVPTGPRRLFLHAVDAQGNLVDQDDRLGAPAEHWQPGDIIVQMLTVGETTADLRLGVYDPRDNRRFLTENGEEFVLLD